MNVSNETTHKSATTVADFFNIESTLSWEELLNYKTENETKIDYFYFYEKEQLTMLWILFVGIVFGNCSVLITLVFSKGRGSRFRFFIKHLAIADLSVGLVNVLTDLVWKFTVEWKAGNIACKIVRYSQAVVTYSSTYVLVALTIDRYDAIRHPMNFSKSWKRAKILVWTAWVLSFVFSTPIIALYEEKYIEGNLQCWIELPEMWHWQIYMTLISITLFFMPACIIATCYFIIIYTIWSKTNILSQNKMNRHTICEVSDSQTEDTDCRRVSSRGLIPKAKIKTIKMTLIIVFVFIFCWSPYMIFDLLQVFGYIERTQSNIALATFIQSLAPLNSAANPIIYCVFSTFVCRIKRKSIPLQWLSKWCFQNHLASNRKVSDTVTFSNVSKNYASVSKMDRKLTPTNKSVIRSSGKEYFKSFGMNLKNHFAGMSEKAKAFSVERLIGAEPDGKKARDITIELCCGDLWEKFSEIGTEMIVTKAGRRMFPILKVRFHGLSLSTTYIVYMDIIPVGESRYRYIYHSSQWMPAGASEVYTGNNIYVHPDSPATGQLWVSQGHISFDKIKLTNNKRPIMTGQISLNSMHKYQPRIHILEVPTSDNLRLNTADDILQYIQNNSDRRITFSFKQTEFITVTAYQNQEITKLKIQSNPFAKGFRETLRDGRNARSQPGLDSGKGCRGRSMTPEWVSNRSPAWWCGKPQRIPLKLVIPPMEMRQTDCGVNGENGVVFYKNYR